MADLDFSERFLDYMVEWTNHDFINPIHGHLLPIQSDPPPPPSFSIPQTYPAYSSNANKYDSTRGSTSTTSPVSNATNGSQSKIASNPSTPRSLESVHLPGKRKREHSPTSDTSPLTPPPKKLGKRNLTEQEKEETNKTRKDSACIPCQLDKRRCTPINPLDPDGPCDRCCSRVKELQCERVNITTLEVFRSGPTLSLAQTQRYLLIANTEYVQSKKIKNLTETSRRSPIPNIKHIRLSQGNGDGLLQLKAQPYKPKETDRVDYTWQNGNIKETYSCSRYALADISKVQNSLENYLDDNTEKYVRTVLADANQVTKKVFDIALIFAKESKLVKTTLRFWVASRFIEKPWHIVGPETLGMTPDVRESSPYHNRVPVTPMMDNQLDLIVIYHQLEPMWKKDLRQTIRSKLLKSNREDWFELQLTMFILLSHIELTTSHDMEFATRHNLQTVFSNIPLITKVNHAAQTLLQYFHNPGINLHAPFYGNWEAVQKEFGLSVLPQNDSTEATKMELQRDFLMTIREMVQQQSKKPLVYPPGHDMSWTSQLFAETWTPTPVDEFMYMYNAIC